jgi:sugar lactone lactonase YvrE
VLSSEPVTKNKIMKNLFTLSTLSLALCLGILSFFSSLTTTTISAQTPSGIESVEYDPEGERWFVSCGSSTILSTSDLGSSWEYFGSANASYGMEVMNGTLFVIHSNKVYSYDLETAEQLEVLSIAGASFLNGMGSDSNGTLIVSDFSAGRILKIDATDPSNMSSSTLVGNIGSSPNGVVVDVANGRAVIVNWGGNADILAVDIENGAVTTLVNGSGLGNCDGIDMDSDGNYYVSSWSPAIITQYNSDFTDSQTVVSSGLSNPADISYDVVNHILGVANSGSNQVTFHDMTELSGIIENSEEFQVEFLANEFIFNLTQGKEFTMTSYTLDGKLLDSSNMSFPSGKSRMALSRLPEAFSKAAIIYIESGGFSKTFKLGLRQL